MSATPQRCTRPDCGLSQNSPVHRLVGWPDYHAFLIEFHVPPGVVITSGHFVPSPESTLSLNARLREEAPAPTRKAIPCSASASFDKAYHCELEFNHDGDHREGAYTWPHSCGEPDYAYFDMRKSGSGAASPAPREANYVQAVPDSKRPYLYRGTCHACGRTATPDTPLIATQPVADSIGITPETRWCCIHGCLPASPAPTTPPLGTCNMNGQLHSQTCGCIDWRAASPNGRHGLTDAQQIELEAGYVATIQRQYDELAEAAAELSRLRSEQERLREVLRLIDVTMEQVPHAAISGPSLHTQARQLAGLHNEVRAMLRAAASPLPEST